MNFLKYKKKKTIDYLIDIDHEKQVIIGYQLNKNMLCIPNKHSIMFEMKSMTCLKNVEKCVYVWDIDIYIYIYMYIWSLLNWTLKSTEAWRWCRETSYYIQYRV